MNQYTKEILNKMCEVVGTNIDAIDTSKEHWFWEHTWSEEEQKEFQEWMIDYLFTNKEARLELMTYPSRVKEKIKQCVNMFIFNYGWKLK